MALNDIYQLSAAQLIAGKEVINTFYFRESIVAGGGPFVIAGALNLEFWSAMWLNQWQDLVTFKLDLTSIYTRRVWPTVSDSVVSQFTAESGTIGNDGVPNGAAVLVSGRPEFTLANFNRRLYFSGLPEIHQSDSSISPAERNNWDDFAFLIRATILAPPSLFPATFTPSAFSQVLADLGSPAPYADIFFSFANYSLRSQRQRNTRRPLIP